MSRKSFFKAGAIIVLGALTITTLAIIWASNRTASVICAITAALSTFYWHKHTAILAWVDGLLKEDPLSIGALTMMLLFICIIGGGGAYSVFGGEIKDFELLFYPIGVVIVLLMLFFVWRYTDHVLPKILRDEQNARQRATTVEFKTTRIQSTKKAVENTNSPNK